VCNSIGPNRILVKCQSIADYHAARAVLKEKSVPFITYQIQDDECPEFTIRGISTETPIAEIKTALINEHVEVIAINQLFTTRPTAAETAQGILTVPKRPVPVFQITLEKNSDVSTFINLEFLMHLKISITPFKRSPFNATTADR
jgi:hypothetical protein